MATQRENGRVLGTELRVVFGDEKEVVELLGKSTAYIERTHLTMRLFNGRLVRKTLAFSKSLQCYRAAALWEDGYYNLIRPHKSLRVPAQCSSIRKWEQRTPAMAAGLTDHIWTVEELLISLPIPSVDNT